jgi:sugar lactone lactonase YvrE
MVTPDGATLVVGETFTGVLHRYRLDPARRYEELAPLATLRPAGEGDEEAGPDGMAFGADGNLYVAHFGSGYVQVVAPDGAIVTSLPAGGISPTNVAFWQESLYVAEGNSGSIYRLDIGVREQPPFMRPW